MSQTLFQQPTCYLNAELKTTITEVAGKFAFKRQAFRMLFIECHYYITLLSQFYEVVTVNFSFKTLISGMYSLNFKLL